ncbi:hypothetical protein LP419_30450 [Massilia sp. H-1]|nr:hypothetical protein LP419_30450 [Massilia sp. H-1]
MTGLVRDDFSLFQWQESRFNLIRHEMRHLTKDGPTISLTSEHWRGGLKGSTTEFTGVYPGDTEPSRYLLACFHLDGAVAAIAIKAASATFEEQRPLYQWILERIVLASGPGRRTTTGGRRGARGRVRRRRGRGGASFLVAAQVPTDGSRGRRAGAGRRGRIAVRRPGQDRGASRHRA